MSQRPHMAQKPDLTHLIQDAATLHRAGHLDAAAMAYRKILKKNPRNPDALHLLGVVLGQQGHSAEGLAEIEKAVRVQDTFPDAHLNAAFIANQMGDLKRAEHHTRKALLTRPRTAIYTNLGELLRAQGRLDEALEAFRLAHTCEPQNPEGYVVYARGLRLTSRMDEMLAVAEAGLKIAPNDSVLRLLASEAQFARGDLQAGWNAYRERFRSRENRMPDKGYTLPFWQGEDLTDRTILVWAEQGPGDEAMYANMYGDIIARARRCVIQCSPRMAPVIRRSFEGAEIFDRNLTAEECAGIDFQCPAASLGEWLRPNREGFPSHPGYLHADAHRRDALRAKYLNGAKDRLLVGIAWRSANVQNATEKSVNLLEWGPILHVPGVTFVNLQYGDCTLEIGEAEKGFRVSILQDTSVDPMRDLDAYAAQVAAMDIVISSSNTAAHFAGALGIPLLCMLPASLGHGRRWYWLERDGHTPWYPTAKLFVQRDPSEWLDIIRDVGLALLDQSAAHGRPPEDYLRAMGQAFADMGRLADAEALYLHMARLPGFAAEAFCRTADLKRRALDADSAFACYARAIAADPTYWRTYNEKGSLFADLNRFDEAIATYQEGLGHNDASPEIHNNLAKALEFIGRNREAVAHYERALAATAPSDHFTKDSIALNYAGALQDRGESQKSLTILDDLIQRTPDHIDAHYNRAQTLLSMNRLEEGWPEMIWRLRRSDALMRYDLFPHVKPWDGEDFAGKKVLMWTELGIGDEILSATMLPDLIATARQVVILCSERLVPVFRRSFPKAKVDARKDPLPKSARATDFDFQVSFTDLGRVFRRSLDDFPKRAGLLQPDTSRRSALRTRYAAVRPGNKLVGLAWASPRNTKIGWLKSNRLEAWRAILETPGVTFVSLQYGDYSAEIEAVRAAVGAEIIEDASIDPLKDMDAFTAQVAAMDAVISVSNTTVHTAGAVGIPVWVLLAEGRGRLWYWSKDKIESPWYPSIRLIRQTPDGDWTPAITKVADELRDWTQSTKENETS